MARRGLSEEQRREAAAQGARRSISRGERPLYRLVAVSDGGWTVEWAPWLSVTGADRRAALADARAAIAVWLEVPTDTFDVE